MELMSDRIALVVEMTEPEKSHSGIILAGATEPQKTNTGVVSFVGPGRLLNDGTQVPVSLKEGDRVLFTPFAGTTLSVDGQEYLIIREADAIAKI